MDWNLVLLMVGIHALMFLTPGPDSIVVVSRAMSQGMRHAYATIFGIVSAGAIFVPAIAFGLDFINSLSPTIWMCVRAAGALYLVYIGVKMLRAAYLNRGSGAEKDQGSISLSQEPLLASYLQGLLTSLGNPKVLVLLTSFLPQFVAEDKGNISTQLVVLGAFMYLNAVVCFSALSFGSILLKRHITQRFKSGTLAFWGGLASGGTMLGVGLWMMIAPLRYVLGTRST